MSNDEVGPPPGRHMAAEVASQPDCWERAGALAAGMEGIVRPGARVAVVGCGTSWFMAQSYAVLREQAGLGETDAFTPSEAPLGRDYDAIVALTRSGTTTEVLEVIDGVRGRVRTLGIVGDDHSPLVDLVDAVVPLPFADERSVVQTRFATSALALLRASLGHDLGSAIAAAHTALVEPLSEHLLGAEQYTFLGTGWTVGLAHEAALKLREAAQCWTESYIGMEYRHGPISIACPRRVTWHFGAPPAGLAAAVVRTGAWFETGGRDPMAELVRAQRVALERAVRGGLDPDHPRNLTRSVVLEP